MTLNKRERLIAIVLGAALGIYAADSFLLEPYLDSQKTVEKQLQTMGQKVHSAELLLGHRKQINDAWKEELANGLKTNASDGEAQALHALTDWAQNSRVTIESHKTDAPYQSGDFQQVRITLTGAGKMSGIARLLWNIETSPLPLQMGELRIQSRKDGTDDLGLQVTVTALVFAPQQPATKPGARRATNGETS